MTQPESEFDPFNASEPILPWQDPGPETYDNSGEPYEAPRRDTSHTEEDATTEHEEDAEIAALIEMLELERERLIEESNIHGAQGSAAPRKLRVHIKKTPRFPATTLEPASLKAARNNLPRRMTTHKAIEPLIDLRSCYRRQDRETADVRASSEA